LTSAADSSWLRSYFSVFSKANIEEESKAAQASQPPAILIQALLG
jgi:hypothetical protein